MLLKFSVEGYRGFGEKITLDLTRVKDYSYNTAAIKNHIIKDALVYGRNGVGKTNLGRAILDARFNVAPETASYRANTSYLNADVKRTVAAFAYHFDFEGERVLYEYTKSARGVICSERLEVGNETVYEVDDSGRWTHNNLARFTSGSLVVEGKDLHLGLSVLSYICTNTPHALLGPILSLYRFLLSMQLNNSVTLDQDIEAILLANRVGELEAFLKEHGIDERLVALPSPAGEEVLYMQKGARPIPFSDVCSSGTQALVRLFSIVELGKSKPSLLFLDEFDAFYHHDLAELVLSKMLCQPDMQIIATTHNTDLFSNKLLRPDCLFVLSKSGITSAADATTRELREGHNLERLYKAGEFDVEE